METVIGNILFYSAFPIIGASWFYLWKKGKKGWAIMGFIAAIFLATLGRGILMGS